MEGKLKTSRRQSPYRPGIRRGPDAPPITDALSAPTVTLLSAILEKAILPGASILAAIDEISDVVAMYRDAKNNTGKFPTVEEQHKSLRNCEVSHMLLEYVLTFDKETKKRLYLYLGKEKPRGQERFEHGRLQFDSWLQEFSEAIEFAASRLPDIGPGRQTEKIYERWLIRNLMAIWENVTGEKPVVSKSRIIKNTASLSPKQYPRWFVETVLDEAKAPLIEDAKVSLNHDQITRYMNEAKIKVDFRRQPSEDSDESDCDYG